MYPFLLANCGTGISINYVEKNQSKHVGGTPLGGASFEGFTKQFLNQIEFNELMKKVEEHSQKTKFLEEKEYITFSGFLQSEFWE